MWLLIKVLFSDVCVFKADLQNIWFLCLQSEKPIASHSKAKKTTSHSKTASKAKARPSTGTQPVKKKSSVNKLELKPDGGVTKKSKEMINRLAEGKK